jgi:hypothetical protein
MKKQKIAGFISVLIFWLLLPVTIGHTSNYTAEFGVSISSGSISGSCFDDVNQDGQINEDEQGIAGVTLTLRRFNFIKFSFSDVGSTETDSEGTYIFSIRRGGIYQVEETDLPGSTSTTPNKVIFLMSVLNANLTINFGDILNSPDTPSVNITANPSTIQKGQSSSLSWSSENADTVYIDQGIGEVPHEGTLTVTPQQTTTYTITATGLGGTAQSSVTVIVKNGVTTTTTIPNPPPTSTSTAIVTTSTQPTTSSVKSTTTTTTATATTTSSTAASTTSSSTTTTLVAESSTTTSQVPTVITLSSFTANPGNSEVTLVWVTESEAGTAGFNIYRADTEDGGYARLNASLIPAQGSSTSGATYTYRDSNLANRRTYFYTLEDVDNTGIATSHGPVHATPLFIYGIQ